jgi:hypothetical protein
VAIGTVVQNRVESLAADGPLGLMKVQINPEILQKYMPGSHHDLGSAGGRGEMGRTGIERESV